MPKSRSRKLSRRSRSRLSHKSRSRLSRKLSRKLRKQRGAGFFNTLKNRVGRIFGSKQEMQPLEPLSIPPIPLSREPSVSNKNTNKNNNYVPPMPPNNSGTNNNWVVVNKNKFYQ